MCLSSAAANGRKDFISESVKLTQITSDSPSLGYCAVALTQVAEIVHAKALLLTENLIFERYCPTFLLVKFSL